MAGWKGELRACVVSPEPEGAPGRQGALDALRASDCSIRDVVEALGEFLVSERDPIRARAMDVLAEATRAVPSLVTTASELSYLAGFFADRLTDWPAVGGALDGAAATAERSTPPTLDRSSSMALARALCEGVDIRALGQRERALGFRLHAALLGGPHSAAIATSGIEALDAVVAALDGERDPRCLRAGLAAATLAVRTYDAEQRSEIASQQLEATVEEAFDVLSCYFPIAFSPRPGDPRGVTREELEEGLAGALCASPLFLAGLLPLVAERTAPGDVGGDGRTGPGADAPGPPPAVSQRTPAAHRVDALRLLRRAAETFGAGELASHEAAAWAALRPCLAGGGGGGGGGQAPIGGPPEPPDEDVADAAGEALAAWLRRSAEAGGGRLLRERALGSEILADTRAALEPEAAASLDHGGSPRALARAAVAVAAGTRLLSALVVSGDGSAGAAGAGTVRDPSRPCDFVLDAAASPRPSSARLLAWSALGDLLVSIREANESGRGTPTDLPLRVLRAAGLSGEPSGGCSDREGVPPPSERDPQELWAAAEALLVRGPSAVPRQAAASAADALSRAAAGEGGTWAAATGEGGLAFPARALARCLGAALARLLADEGGSGEEDGGAEGEPLALPGEVSALLRRVLAQLGRPGTGPLAMAALAQLAARPGGHEAPELAEVRALTLAGARSELATLLASPAPGAATVASLADLCAALLPGAGRGPAAPTDATPGGRPALELAQAAAAARLEPGPDGPRALEALARFAATEAASTAGDGTRACSLVEAAAGARAAGPLSLALLGGAIFGTPAELVAAAGPPAALRAGVAALVAAALAAPAAAAGRAAALGAASLLNAWPRGAGGPASVGAALAEALDGGLAAATYDGAGGLGGEAAGAWETLGLLLRGAAMAGGHAADVAVDGALRWAERGPGAWEARALAVAELLAGMVAAGRETSLAPGGPGAPLHGASPPAATPPGESLPPLTPETAWGFRDSPLWRQRLASRLVSVLATRRPPSGGAAATPAPTTAPPSRADASPALRVVLAAALGAAPARARAGVLPAACATVARGAREASERAGTAARTDRPSPTPTVGADAGADAGADGDAAGRAAWARVATSALRALVDLAAPAGAGRDAVAGSASDIVLACSALSSPPSPPDARAEALRDLGALAARVPYAALHPLRRAAKAAIARALDDDRRAVRREAARAADAWAGGGAT